MMNFVSSSTTENTLQDKLNSLSHILSTYKQVIVLYSGGVDSSFLLESCVKAIGKESTLALIGNSPSLPIRELNEARAFANELGVELKELHTSELQNTNYTANSGNRCYYCKTELYSSIAIFLRTNPQYKDCSILDGLQASDSLNDRPGVRASLEFGIKHPLRIAEITKEDIRMYFSERGHPISDKPEMACLSSRLMPGTIVTKELLLMVEQAEILLNHLGFKGFRVRVHDLNQGSISNGILARVEFSNLDDFYLFQNKSDLTDRLIDIGFSYVTIDLQGYKKGGFSPTKLVKLKIPGS